MNRLYLNLSAGALLLLYLLAAGAPFFAPYSHKEQFRDFFYAPPTRIHFRDAEGGWHLRPFVYEYERAGSTPQYHRTWRRLPVYFFVKGTPYRMMGVTWDRHLLGLIDTPRKIFLLGSDGLGRDLFSRILYGAQVSLTIGLVGIILAGVLGAISGGVSGYFAGWLDTLFMRTADALLSLPGLFLVLGIRALFPLELSAMDIYWVLVLIFTLMGWASVTRVVRGQVLSLKTQDYVLAARAAGASHWRILRRHILPFTSHYLLVQSTVFIPAYILGEVTLSFLGVGVQEPDASWGNLLAEAASIQAMTRFPWLLSPALFLWLTVFSFHVLGDELEVLDKARQRWW